MDTELECSTQSKTSQDLDTFLEHHGVKGQKWGRRNKKVPVKPSKDHAEVAKIREKHIHALSNQELKTINERLNLESNYDRLVNPKKTQSAGKKKAKEILAAAGLTSGAGAVKKFLKTPAGKAAIARGEKATRPILLSMAIRGGALAYKFK